MPRLHKAGFKPKTSFVMSWVTVSLISQGTGRERVVLKDFLKHSQGGSEVPGFSGAGIPLE